MRCDCCELKRQLPSGVWGALSLVDPQIKYRLSKYQRGVTEHFCPIMRSSGATSRCYATLQAAAKRMPRDPVSYLGLWRWLLQDEAGKAIDQVTDEKVLRYADEPRGQSLSQILEQIA